MQAQHDTVLYRVLVSANGVGVSTDSLSLDGAVRAAAAVSGRDYAQLQTMQVSSMVWRIVDGHRSMIALIIEVES